MIGSVISGVFHAVNENALQTEYLHSLQRYGHLFNGLSRPEMRKHSPLDGPEKGHSVSCIIHERQSERLGAHFHNGFAGNEI